RAQTGSRSRNAADLDWSGDRADGFVLVDASDVEPFVRRERDGPAHVCCDLVASGWRGAGSLLFARSPRNQGRSDGRAEIRMKRFWILDCERPSVCVFNPKSKIENPKSAGGE